MADGMVVVAVVVVVGLWWVRWQSDAGGSGGSGSKNRVIAGRKLVMVATFRERRPTLPGAGPEAAAGSSQKPNNFTTDSDAMRLTQANENCRSFALVREPSIQLLLGHESKGASPPHERAAPDRVCIPNQTDR